MPAKPNNPKQSDQNPSDEPGNALEQSSGGETANLDAISEVVKQLFRVGGVPITLTLTPANVVDTARRLNEKLPVTVAFPPCSEELLALINTRNPPNKDDITLYFDEYFRFGERHVIVKGALGEVMDADLLRCSQGGEIVLTKPQTANAADSAFKQIEWTSDCCLCSPCLTLNGNRNPPPPPAPNQPPHQAPVIKRLFIGDLVWLFYFERMGIFQILGAILDAYASNGRLPISNGSIDAGIRDDVVALVLEVMTRQTKTGMSSTVRDRGCSYQTALGWASPAARKLNLDTNLNTGFNTLFHKFIFHALEFYKDKRLAVAIRGTAAPVAPPSVATLITISDTLDVLKKRFESFDYGRVYNNTLSGIMWTIAGMSIIRELRTTLGIPPAFDSPHEYIPAAYDLLVLKRPVTSGETNRYLVHKECARNGRDILLDLEVINHQDKNPGGELENWLTQIEAKIEAYRTAYRALTNVDIGAALNPTIEQQA